MSAFPVLLHPAFDATDCRGPAEFYQQFLGLLHRCGDEIPAYRSGDDPDRLGTQLRALGDPLGHALLRSRRRTMTGRFSLCQS